MKRNHSHETNHSSEDTSMKEKKAKRSETYVFVEETNDNSPPVGAHHDGSMSVYMNHKVAKLRDMHRGDHIAKVSSIFDSCIIYVNGVTNPPIEEIRRIVTVHGGECVNYRVDQVTHFVCDYFTDAQLKIELSRQRLNTVRTKVHNVTAAWIIESVNAGKRLTETNFIPKGLKLRVGPNVLEMMNNTANPSKSTADLLSVEEIDLVHTPSPQAVPPAGLTHSQEQFLKAVPKDLQSDVLEQLTAKATEGSSRAVISLLTQIDSPNQNSNSSFRSEEESKDNERKKPFSFHSITCKEELQHVLYDILNPSEEEQYFSLGKLPSSLKKMKLRQILRTKIGEQLQTHFDTSSSNSLSIEEFHQFFVCMGIWFLEREELELTESMIEFLFKYYQAHPDLGHLLQLDSIVKELQLRTQRRYGNYLSVD